MVGEVAAGRPAQPARAVAGEAGPVKQAVTQLGDAVLYGYSQILFIADRRVGALLLAVTLLRPSLGSWGLAAVLLSLGVVRLVGFKWELARRGLYSYNPLLVGLACGAFLVPSAMMVGLFVGAVIATVFVQTALESALGTFFNLPVLSLPFVLVTFVVLGGAGLTGGVALAEPMAPLFGSPAWLPPGLAGYLRSLGAVFFSTDLFAGLLVLIALLVYSRIATLLSVGAYLLASLLVAQASLASEAAPTIVATNAILVAIALGGVWFVPQPSSFALAAGGVLLTVFFTLAAFIFLLPVRLPVLILPFNLALLTALYALRQRERDGAPKAVDFLSGSPETNLHYYQTRLARFGARLGQPFILPFSGRWTVSQGFDGAHTHRGLWRHALDFEVHDDTGKNHRGSGTELGDYLCYRLPVFAAADGTVVKVVGNIPDNRIGDRRPRDNFGNVVVLQHGLGLFSLVAHLTPGSVAVHEGQLVRAGAKLGLCGNSGRSFTPHLHFQLQRTPMVGAPTVALELSDVVYETSAGPELRPVGVPQEGDAVRNLERSDARACRFTFPLGSTWRFAREHGGRQRTEELTAKIDLFSNLYLEDDRHNRFYFENQGRQFVAYDYLGAPFTTLHLLYLAAPRVPFEDQDRLGWEDVVGDRHLRSTLLEPLRDLIAPFSRRPGAVRSLAAATSPAGLVVHGSGLLAGQRAITESRFDGDGPVEISLQLGDRRIVARRLEVNHVA